MAKVDFKKDSYYKIVYRSDDKVKIAKGSIVGYDQVLIQVMFNDGFVLSINLKDVITVGEIPQ